MEPRAHLFDIKRDCSDDGPGIRTTVFFKGCPLACGWCHNPEGLSGRLSLNHRQELCHPERCQWRCVASCSKGVFQQQEGKVLLNRSRCDRCNDCFSHCPSQAIMPVGFDMGLEELLYRVTIDLPFYRATGGGVTVSGGEPTHQLPFLAAFLPRLRELGVDTTLETCGFFPYDLFAQRVLPHLNRIYYDLKIMAQEEHRHQTGRSNRLILENLSRLSRQSQVEVVVRVALIPAITATTDNLRAMGAFLRSLNLSSVVLLPCNPTGRDKYISLGLPPPPPLAWMEEEALNACTLALFA